MKKKYLIPERQVVMMSTTAPIMAGSEHYTPNGDKINEDSNGFLAPTFSGDDSGEDW